MYTKITFIAQAAQTHVAREGCNVIYITYLTRAGVALQATVENIRDFVWEIYHWDLRTPNNAKPYFFLNEMNKKVLPAIYSAAVWCLFVVLLFFWLYCVTTLTPFIECGKGYFRDSWLALFFPVKCEMANFFLVALRRDFAKLFSVKREINV